MPNGVTINGVSLGYQGRGTVRRDLTTEKAAAALRNNGLDEIILSYKNDKGQTERAVVWGDRLDLSFRKGKTEPVVTIDGRPAKIVHFDNEATTFGEGALRGAAEGYRDAFDTLSDVGKKTLKSLAIGTGAVMTGGVVLAAAKGTASIVAGAAIAKPVAIGAVTVGAIAVVVVGAAGALKGGFGAESNLPKTETIASVIDPDAN